MKYSVVIPCYNCAKTVERAIRSAISEDTEIICVDDGSTDATLALLCALSEQEDIVDRVVALEKNCGPGHALNEGIDVAQAPLIFVLGADNYIPANLLPTLDKAMAEAQASIAAPSEIRYFGTRKGKRYNLHNKDGFCDIDTYVKTKKNHGSSGHYLFTKLSWHFAGGYPEEPGLEGWVFGLRQLAAGYKAVIVPNTHYYHCLSKNSLWKRWERQGLNDKAVAKAIKESLG